MIFKIKLYNMMVILYSIKIKYDEIEEEMTRWEVANEVYYGKDRDMKNFPHMPIPEKCPPVKFGILPGSWFTAMYNKTGVSGTC